MEGAIESGLRAAHRGGDAPTRDDAAGRVRAELWVRPAVAWRVPIACEEAIAFCLLGVPPCQEAAKDFGLERLSPPELSGLRRVSGSIAHPLPAPGQDHFAVHVRAASPSHARAAEVPRNEKHVVR